MLGNLELSGLLNMHHVKVVEVPAENYFILFKYMIPSYFLEKLYNLHNTLISKNHFLSPDVCVYECVFDSGLVSQSSSKLHECPSGSS